MLREHLPNLYSEYQPTCVYHTARRMYDLSVIPEKINGVKNEIRNNLEHTLVIKGGN